MIAMSRSAHRVCALPLPVEAGINRLYPRVELADAYAVTLPDDAVRDPERLARFMFERPAPLAHALMGMRDAVVSLFGIKTGRSLVLDGKQMKTRRVGMFKIYSVTADEIVMGEDDKHLDVRMSLLVQPRQGVAGTQVVLSTVVH